MSKAQIIEVLVDLTKTMRDFVKYLPGQPRGPDGRFAGGGVGGMAPDTGGSYGGGPSEGEGGGSSSGRVGSQKEWEDSLSGEERDSIARYTGKRGYTDIRRCMNAGVGCNENIRKHIKNISTALDRGPLKEREVYRGLNFSSSKKRDEFVAIVLRDKVLEDKGFVSTAALKSLADIFSGNKKPYGSGAFHKEMTKAVLIKVKTKRGVSISKLSKYKGESEVLIPQNSKWKLTKIRKDYWGQGKENYRVILYMEAT